MSTTAISFIVLGVAQPKSSTEVFTCPSLRFPVVANDNPTTKPWTETVRLVAQQHGPNGGPWDGPVQLATTFSLPRPKSLPKRVQHHTKKSDLDKLVRAGIA